MFPHVCVGFLQVGSLNDDGLVNLPGCIDAAVEYVFF